VKRKRIKSSPQIKIRVHSTSEKKQLRIIHKPPILTIKRLYFDKILSGEKCIEYRPFRFGKEVDTVVLCVKEEEGIKVTHTFGEFDKGIVYKAKSIDNLWKRTKKCSGMHDKSEFYKNCGKWKELYAIEVIEVREYEYPIPIEQWGLKGAPERLKYATKIPQRRFRRRITKTICQDGGIR
jgi:predicted transcriptional regulator